MNAPRTIAAPFVRYPGKKSGKLLSAILDQVPTDFDGDIVIPFLGGGGVLWGLLERLPHHSGQLILSDACKPLIALWMAVRDDVDELLALLEVHARWWTGCNEARRQRYNRDRSEFNARIVANDYDVDTAALYYTLLQTCHNGLSRFNQAGGFSASYQPDRPASVIYSDERAANLRACSAALQGAIISLADFAEVLDIEATAGSLVYADSPYPGGFDLYTPDRFTEADHRRLAACLTTARERGAHVIASNGDHPLVRALYPTPTWHHQPVSRAGCMSADASQRGRVGELLITPTQEVSMETENTPTFDADAHERDTRFAEELAWVVGRVEDWLANAGRFEAMDKISKHFAQIKHPARFPGHLPEPFLMRLAELAGLDAEIPGALPIVADLVARYPERAHLRGGVFEVRWKVGTWSGGGARVYGSCKPTPKAYRECWTGHTPAPHWRLTLSLPYWLIASADARTRLIHHELGHCAWKDAEKKEPGSRPHDAKVFADTIARFGLMDGNEGHALAAIAIGARADTAEKTAGYADRQKLLFAPVWTEAQVAAEGLQQAVDDFRSAIGKDTTVTFSAPPTSAKTL
jgi:DNA adenine methylase